MKVSFSDDDCKIAPIDKTVLFVETGTGAGGDENGAVVWDGGALAKQAYQEREGKIAEAARRWAELVAQAIDRRPQDLPSMLYPGYGITKGTFLWVDENGKARVLATDLKLNVKPEGVTVDVDWKELHGPIIGLAAGQSEVLEFLANATERAKLAQQAIQQRLAGTPAQVDRDAIILGAAVQAAIDWSGDPSIGGPIDVAVLSKDGIRWIQRKPNCK